MCSGQRVPWLSAAGSLIERLPQRGRVDNGRLMLRLGAAWQRRGLVPVGFRHPFNDPDQTLAFPAGFAPALGSGVRFVGSPVAPPTVVDAKPEPRPEAKVVKAESRPLVVATEPVPSKAREPAISEGWAATVTTSAAAASGSRSAIDGTQIFRGLVVLVFGLGLVSALVLVRRQVEAAQGKDTRSDKMGSGSADAAQPFPPPNASDAAALCAELVARAVNLHQTSREAVGALPNDNLREILSNDLAAVQRRLLSAELTEDVAEERWALVQPVVTKALADLERIARIIAGVLSSQPIEEQSEEPKAAALSIPTTVHEAFEVLGVNSEASRTVVKKVVDGLRQSWHPDHGRDEDDRARREERMKQINSAWDLIRSAHEERAEAEQAA